MTRILFLLVLTVAISTVQVIAEDGDVEEEVELGPVKIFEEESKSGNGEDAEVTERVGGGMIRWGSAGRNNVRGGENGMVEERGRGARGRNQGGRRASGGSETGDDAATESASGNRGFRGFGGRGRTGGRVAAAGNGDGEGK